jgi:tetratricopeptide (TPR) repeat protein/predicted aspartyl protease
LSVAAGPAAAACKLTRLVEFPVTMEGMSPVVAAKVNGHDARFMADTGAFFSMITPSSAAKFGLHVGPLPAWLTVVGVNGEAKAGLASVKSLTVVGAELKNMDFIVGGSLLDAYFDGVIGQNVLNGVDLELDLANGAIRMFKSTDCEGATLAYWVGKDLPFSVISRESLNDRRIIGSAKINGRLMKVLFDTGSTRSILSMPSAVRAGIKVDGPDIVPAGLAGGLGRKSIETFIAPVDSFAIGDEQIKSTRLLVGRIQLQDDEDMILGTDFFLSHRVYISTAQKKIYFSYNGGPVFRLDEPPRTQAAAGTAPASDEPKDASGFDRRGAALAARRDYARAIADFGRAMELDPNEARYAYDRGMARIANAQPILAMSDIDTALRLKPDDTRALMARAELRLASRDEAGARSDFEAAARKDPTQRLAIAGFYAAVDRYEDAIPHLDQWIAANPGHDELASAYNARCWARAMLGKELEKAQADCDMALRLRPHTSAFLDSRGMVRLRQSQLDGSIADYDEAIKLQVKSGWSYYGRGLAKLKKGLKADGEADVAAAKALDPRIADDAKRHGIAP